MYSAAQWRRLPQPLMFVSLVVLYEILTGPVTVCSLLHLLKVTLDLQNSTEKFGGFLRSALDVLSQILELATLQDIGKVCVLF